MWRVKANKGSAGIDGMTVDELPDLRETVGHPGLTAERDLHDGAGETGGNPQTGRRGAQTWHSNGAGSICPASGDAGLAEAVGPDVFRHQLWFPAGPVDSSGGGASAAVYRCRLRLGGRSGFGEILRSGQS